MAGGENNGLASAIALCGGAGAGADPSNEQPQLFADADDAPLPMAAPERTGRPGRPKGARNRSTEEWRQYILSRYRSPLVFLAECYSRTPAQLAEELGLYKYHEGKMVLGALLDAEGRAVLDGEGRTVWVPVLDTGAAVKLQADAAMALAPYVHQKQPLAIETKGEQRGLLVINIGGAPGAGEDHAVAFAPIEENQRVIDGEIAKSDDTQSDDATKPRESNENAD